MKVGEKLAELLAKNGVKYVYGVPGGQSLPLYEGIRKLPDQIQHVLMRDERSAGYAADAYARLTGRTGVCDATVGPGATNLVSPLAEAYCSSIPVLAILSDIPRAWEHRRMRGNASQGVQQVDIFRTVSKWQVTVNDPRMLEDVLDTSFRMATTGKPGPVVISVPVDIGMADFSFREGSHSLQGSIFPRFRTAPDPKEVGRAVPMLLKARKPVLVVGGGAHISGADQQNHPQAFGVTGVFGNPIACEILQQADLVFFIGSKIGELTTFGFRVPPRSIPVIHLDADPEEIGRNFIESVPLLADACLGLDAIIASLDGRKSAAEWDFRAFKEKQQKWYDEKTSLTAEKDQPLKPQAVMGALNQVLTEKDVVVCDASLSSGWASAYLKLNTTGHRFIAPRGLAGIGWGAPAAIGAALAANKEARILTIAGDGGFSYSVQELEVMNRLKLPVVIIVLNNNVLGWIKHAQKFGYQENYISTDFSQVDFATVAKGFGARGYTAHSLDELKDCLAKEKSPQGPAVIDVIVDQWESPVHRL
ncbi:MAG: thiamine pyrophosphate-binding protein [Deltaproteobacteria bacterium]|nr:thiamine pyrophosphate-binding protein [Deltaproteobacteria bacterium]